MYDNKKNSGRKEGYKFHKGKYSFKKQNSSQSQYNKYNRYRSRFPYSKTSSFSSHDQDTDIYTTKNTNENQKTAKCKEFIAVSEFSITLNKETKTDDKKNISTTLENSDKNDDLNISSKSKSSIITEQNITNSQLFPDDKENLSPNILNKPIYNNNLNNIKGDQEEYLINSFNILNNSPQSSLNLSIQDLKDVFYIPKKLNNIYKTYSHSNSQQIDTQQNYNLLNTIQNKNIPLSVNNMNFNYNQNILGTENSNFNYLLNNNYLNTEISPQISPFKLYDSPILPKKTYNSSLDLNKTILKTQINNFFEKEKDKENTDILEINVKISEKKTLVFKIRRYDDMFKTVKIFCEINKLDTKLIRPFIIYIIKALNSIYGVYNLNLKSEEIRFLKDIKENFFMEDNEEDKSIGEREYYENGEFSENGNNDNMIH